jgi:ribosomal protein S20
MNELDKLEQIIETGLESFYAVGQALWRIRERQLYAGEYKTFDEYCALKWGMKSKRAYQLMSGAMIQDNLMSTGVYTLPANEAQTRPLATLPDELQPVAWASAIKASQELDMPISQSLVKQAVQVVNAAMNEGAITIGGDQFSFQDLLNNQVVNEVVEARARQRQHIKDNTASRQVARYCAKWNGTSFEITDTSFLSIGETYQILVYTVGERNHD